MHAYQQPKNRPLRYSVLSKVSVHSPQNGSQAICVPLINGQSSSRRRMTLMDYRPANHTLTNSEKGHEAVTIPRFKLRQIPKFHIPRRNPYHLNYTHTIHSTTLFPYHSNDMTLPTFP